MINTFSVYALTDFLCAKFFVPKFIYIEWKNFIPIYYNHPSDWESLQQRHLPKSR